MAAAKKAKGSAKKTTAKKAAPPAKAKTKRGGPAKRGPKPKQTTLERLQAAREQLQATLFEAQKTNELVLGEIRTMVEGMTSELLELADSLKTQISELEELTSEEQAQTGE